MLCCVPCFLRHGWRDGPRFVVCHGCAKLMQLSFKKTGSMIGRIECGMNHFVLPEQPLLIGFHLFYELIFDAIRNFFVTEFGFELFDLLACFFQLFAVASCSALRLSGRILENIAILASN